MQKEPDEKTNVIQTILENESISIVQNDNGRLSAGSIIHICMPDIPCGFLPANGTTISRIRYPNIFACIGTAYGRSDGVHTFNLPDLRSEFIRDLDCRRGVDAHRMLDSVQNDEFRNHFHGFLDTPKQPLNTGIYALAPLIIEVSDREFIATTSAGGKETRP